MQPTVSDLRGTVSAAPAAEPADGGPPIASGTDGAPVPAGAADPIFRSDGQLPDQPQPAADGDLKADGVIAGPAPADAVAPESAEPRLRPTDLPQDSLAADRPVRRPTPSEPDADPYAPQGVRLGGFLIRPGIGAGALFSDNVLQSADHRQSGIALVLRPSLLAQSQWSRHEVALELRGAITDYAALAAGNTADWHIGIRGRIDIASLVSLEADAAFDDNALARSDPAVAAGTGLRPTARTSIFGLAYVETFDRLSLRLHGSDAVTAIGNSSANRERYNDAVFDARAAYEVSPGLTISGSAKTDSRNFADSSGIDAQSTDLRVGFATDPSARLSVTASAGGTSISASGAPGTGASGAVAEASVTWLPSALTTVTITALSDLELTDAAGSAALRNDKFGIDVRHQFRRWLALVAGITQARQDYAGIGLSDVLRTAHIGLEYDLDRTWAVFTDYQRQDTASSDPARSFTEDQVTLGLRLQR